MRSLYIAATEASAGKTTLSLGLCRVLRSRGVDVGYFKPVGSAPDGPLDDADAPDDDAAFVAGVLDLPDDPRDLCPLRMDESSLKPSRPSAGSDPRAVLREAYASVAAHHDLLVCEGLGEIWQGRFLRISGADVVGLLDLPTVLVARFTGARQLDDVFYVHDAIKGRLRGVIFNMVPETRVDAVEQRLSPLLAENHVPSFGLLPVETKLAAVPIGVVAARLNGRFLVGEGNADRLAETYLIGAMSPEHALAHFERAPNKIVVVGGDRDDLILTALQTSTAALVLTGEFTPGADVIDLAASLGVALISVTQDTVRTADVLRRLFGSLRVHEPSKTALIERLVAERVDVDGLLAELA